MPTYVYTCRCGHKMEAFRKVEHRNRAMKCEECGQRANRSPQAELLRVAADSDNWPLTSVSLGVPTKYIDKAKRYYRALGVNVDFNPRGDMVFENRSHRNKVLRARGAVDYSGGYGDHTS